MAALSSLITACSVFLAEAAVKQAATPSAPLKGTVLDVFENNRCLVSVGKKQGLKKGSWVGVFRVGREIEHIGNIELLEVGKEHSVGRFERHRLFFRFDPSLTAQIGDTIRSVPPFDWPQYLPPPPVNVRARDEIDEIQRLRNDMPGFRRYEPGGAIIDLTLPKERK